MKNLVFCGLFLIAMILPGAASMAHELTKIYSHVVLNLPFDKISDESWNKVIDTQEEWSDFYLNLIEENTFDSAASNVPPKIDFKAFRIITGGIGIRPSGGYSVSINKVIESNDAVYIDALVIKPGDNCLVTAQITYPSITIMIRKSDKPISFFARELTQECDT